MVSGCRSLSRLAGRFNPWSPIPADSKTRCWILSAGRWIPDAGRWVLGRGTVVGKPYFGGAGSRIESGTGLVHNYTTSTKASALQHDWGVDIGLSDNLRSLKWMPCFVTEQRHLPSHDLRRIRIATTALKRHRSGQRRISSSLVMVCPVRPKSHNGLVVDFSKPARCP